MAFALGCEDIHLEYATKLVFDGVTLGVDEGERIGIVGRNGDGKTSLLSILSGTMEPDSGRVFKRNDFTIGTVKQQDELDPEQTVVYNIFGDVPEYTWASDPRIRDVLEHLVGNIELDAKVGDLSGGERHRVDIARVLVREDDILMLDEPTNHLDMVSISWLAGHLNRRWQGKSGVLLVVTHDRWFLDEVCNHMWEVHDGTVEPFDGGYSAYVLQRVEREEAARVAEEKRQNLLRRELAWLSRGARARSSKPKFHVEAAEALIADEPPTRDTIELKRTAVARLGKQAVDFIDVSKSFGDKVILDDVTWTVAPGDRIGLLGENGVGKTTILKLIQGKLEPDSGHIRIGKTVKMAVLSQRLEELDDFGDYEVREVLSRYRQHYTIDGKEYTSTQLLERLGFKRAHFQLPVSKLSGGQKRRLQLMLTLLEGSNVLILDEPGNDMDIDMLSQIENVLDSWPGTLILVTHDRYLMEHVTDNQYAVVNGKIVHVPGGIDQYLHMLTHGGISRTDGRVDVLEVSGSENGGSGNFKGGSAGKSQGGAGGSSSGGNVGSSGDDGGAGAGVSHKLSNSERQAARKRLASAERRMDTMRRKIDDAKTALAEADQTDYEELMKREGEIEKLEGELSSIEDEWLEASELLEEADQPDQHE
ncbi:MAG: ABC-F family ATP-binding cassette domain-containing protein [Coriobacteriales bacterium]